MSNLAILLLAICVIGLGFMGLAYLMGWFKKEEHSQQ